MGKEFCDPDKKIIAVGELNSYAITFGRCRLSINFDWFQQVLEMNLQKCLEQKHANASAENVSSQRVGTVGVPALALSAAVSFGLIQFFVVTLSSNNNFLHCILI